MAAIGPARRVVYAPAPPPEPAEEEQRVAPAPSAPAPVETGGRRRAAVPDP